MNIPRRHVIISGTGRTGTTFLVELLTNLGLDTGVGKIKLTPKKELANAGLEYDIRKDDAPYIIKNPGFCDYADEVIKREDIILDHVFIPMRDIRAAAESRRQVTRINVANTPYLKRVKMLLRKLLFKQVPRPYSGGLWSTSNDGAQESILMEKLYKLLLAVSEADVPVTLLKYPKHVSDSKYLFKKLQPILGSIDYDYFDEIFRKTVRKELIHSFGDTK